MVCDWWLWQLYSLMVATCRSTHFKGNRQVDSNTDSVIDYIPDPWSAISDVCSIQVPPVRCSILVQPVRCSIQVQSVRCSIQMSSMRYSLQMPSVKCSIQVQWLRCPIQVESARCSLHVEYIVLLCGLCFCMDCAICIVLLYGLNWCVDGAVGLSWTKLMCGLYCCIWSTTMHRNILWHYIL